MELLPISKVSAVEILDGTEIFPTIKGGEPEKVTIGQVRDYIGSSIFNRIAGTPIGGFKVVRDMGDGTTAALASCDDTDHAGLILGVTLHAADADAALRIMRQGEIVDTSMQLTPGPLFLGLNGDIVSLPSVSGVLVLIGNAVSSSAVVINVQLPIMRG